MKCNRRPNKDQRLVVVQRLLWSYPKGECSFYRWKFSFHEGAAEERTIPTWQGSHTGGIVMRELRAGGKIICPLPPPPRELSMIFLVYFASRSSCCDFNKRFLCGFERYPSTFAAPMAINSSGHKNLRVKLCRGKLHVRREQDAHIFPKQKNGFDRPSLRAEPPGEGQPVLIFTVLNI